MLGKAVSLFGFILLLLVLPSITVQTTSSGNLFVCSDTTVGDVTGVYAEAAISSDGSSGYAFAKAWKVRDLGYHLGIKYEFKADSVVFASQIKIDLLGNSVVYSNLVYKPQGFHGGVSADAVSLIVFEDGNETAYIIIPDEEAFAIAFIVGCPP